MHEPNLVLWHYTDMRKEIEEEGEKRTYDARAFGSSAFAASDWTFDFFLDLQSSFNAYQTEKRMKLTMAQSWEPWRVWPSCHLRHLISLEVDSMVGHS
jgi:hypothetical protein